MALLTWRRKRRPEMNEQTWMLFAGSALLLLASLVGFVLKWRAGPGPNAVIDNLNARINAWWAMVLVIGFAFWLGQAAVILLFYGVSFYALREFITLTPTRRSDYPALVAAFYRAADAVPADLHRLVQHVLDLHPGVRVPAVADPRLAGR